MVICEGVAGGIIHGLHLPFSGMILSGFAVICICLIGYVIADSNALPTSFKENKIQWLFFKGAIIKATIIVCIFKMMLSPHTPPTAYFAVLFQGFLGQILFSKRENFKLSCIILGCLALIESALQRILVLVILYGTDFWKAINEFIEHSLGLHEMNNYALFVALGYVLIHAIVGIYIGVKAANLIQQTRDWQLVHKEFLIQNLDQIEIIKKEKRGKKHIKKVFFIFWIILILLFIQSIFKIGQPVLTQNKAFLVLLRSILIFLTWYFVLSPILVVWIKKKLKTQEAKSRNDIAKILQLLPNTEKIFSKSWQLSSSRKYVKRIALFWKILWMNILIFDEVDA